MVATELAPGPPRELTPDERRVLELYREGRLQAPHRTPAWRVIAEALLALRSLVSLAALALMIFLVLSITSLTGSLDQRITGAAQRTGQAVTAAAQAVGDVFNPTHPPRYAISQDTEFSSLQTLGLGDVLGRSSEYLFTLADIRRRNDPSTNPDFVQYAVLQRQYQVPHETKLLGLTIHVDRGEQQYILDRGESFRIGSQLYKVNWISSGDIRMAVATYRDPDQFAGELAFQSS
jgi:hypothetical protein